MTKAPDYQWGPREDRIPDSGKRFTSVINTDHIVNASGVSIQEFKVELNAALNDTDSF